MLNVASCKDFLLYGNSLCGRFTCNKFCFHNLMSEIHTWQSRKTTIAHCCWNLNQKDRNCNVAAMHTEEIEVKSRNQLVSNVDKANVAKTFLSVGGSSFRGKCIWCFLIRIAEHYWNRTGCIPYICLTVYFVTRCYCLMLNFLRLYPNQIIGCQVTPNMCRIIGW